MPLFTAVDARNLWESTEDKPAWTPVFLQCGSFDYGLEAFPVKTMSGVHHLWIPVEWKSALRFLNHAMYCAWHASLDQRLSDTKRTLSMRRANYAEQLRHGFFHEVLDYWYPPGTELPTNEEPTRQNHPLHSCYLTSFLVNMYNINSLIPPESEVGLAEWEQDPALFDWERWAKKRPTNRARYGVLPHAGTEEYKRLSEENRVARIPNAPSVEIDSSSWSRYASILVEHASLPQSRSAMPVVPSHPPCAAEADTKHSSASPAPQKKRARKT